MEIYTQMLDIFTPGNVIYIGEEHHPFTIERTRWKQDLLLLKFEEINDRTTVSGLTNQFVFIQADALPGLPDGDYYYHELIGLKVYEESGAYLGVLTQVLETGANDVYLVQAEDGEEVLIPAIKEMILEIDPASKKMVVSRMEWYGEGE